MKLLTRANVLLFACTALVCRADRPVLSFQLSNTPVIDHSVAIGVIPIVRGSAYATRTRDDVPVIYVGEEVQLAITVANATDIEIALGEDSRSWVNDLRLTVAQQQQGRAGRPPVRVASRARFGQQGRVTLTPGRSAHEQVTLRDDAGGPLPAGTYTIAIELPTLAGLGKGERITRREVNFEVREPRTREDVLDQYLHEVFRAKAENRVQDERMWINRVLELHPNSLVAWLDLAGLYDRQGDCKGAVPALTRALELLTLGLDPDLKVRPPASHAVYLQERLQKCGVRVR